MAVPALSHVITLCFSIAWHLSLVPSAQVLFWVWLPFPHCFRWLPLGRHCPIFLHGPNFLRQSGLLQLTDWYMSEWLHRSNVPSTQLLFCLWIPGPHDLSEPVATHDSTLPVMLDQLPSCFEQSFSLQDMLLSVIAGLHLWFGPSWQYLVCLCIPGPHDLSKPTAMQVPKLTHSPTVFPQSDWIGVLQWIFRVKSWVVHLSLVPSTQLLVCLWFPVPHIFLSGLEDMQYPSLTQSPSFFGWSGMFQENFAIKFKLQRKN